MGFLVAIGERDGLIKYFPGYSEKREQQPKKLEEEEDVAFRATTESQALFYPFQHFSGHLPVPLSLPLTAADTPPQDSPIIARWLTTAAFPGGYIHNNTSNLMSA